MRRISLFLVLVLVLLGIAGCSRDTGEKIRYEMEKLSYEAGKTSQRINIQPELASAADSAALKEAYQAVLAYYFRYHKDSRVSGNDSALLPMQHLAISAEAQLARIFMVRRQPDSALAAYRAIGRDIPAGREDLAGATLALALTYRALRQFDSTLVLYDRLLAAYYPPTDSLGQPNADLIAIPIDKMKIARAQKDEAKVSRYFEESIAYYDRLKQSFPGTMTARTATIYAGRAYAMNEKWDKALAELEQVTDSTGQTSSQALLIMAGILDGPGNDSGRAMGLYRRILEMKADSSILGRAMLGLGSALCQGKKYDDGRQVLADVKKKFEKYPSLVASAQLTYAQTFEQEGRWDRALSEYQWLMENFPYSEEAFRIALHIPEHFAALKDRKMADIWYGRAIEFYQTAAVNKQGQQLALAAYTFLADTYRRMGRWQDALETLDKISTVAPQSPLAARALFNAARVAYAEMKDSTLARSYIDRLQRTFGTTDSSAIHQEEKPEFNLESIE